MIIKNNKSLIEEDVIQPSLFNPEFNLPRSHFKFSTHLIHTASLHYQHMFHFLLFKHLSSNTSSCY